MHIYKKQTEPKRKITMFTGKAKELFNNFIVSSLEGEIIHGDAYFKLNGFVFPFEKLPLSMKIGVIEDFAESLGYFIRKDVFWLGFGYYVYTIKQGTKEIFKVQRNDKNEAREEMIKQFNDLINGQHTN